MRIAAVTSVGAGVLFAATLFAADAPRTPWGDPDLRGTYTSDNSIGVPFERAQERAGPKPKR